MRCTIPYPWLTSALLALATIAATHAAEAPDVDPAADPETEIETRTVYVIELIVFAHQAGLAGSEERWPPELELPDWRQAILPQLAVAPDGETGADAADTTTAAATATTDANAVDLAGPEELLGPASVIPPRPEVWIAAPEQIALAEPLARLQRDPRYDVLLHTAWQQEGLPREQAFQVIVSDVPMDQYYPTDEELAAESSEPVADAPSAVIAGTPAAVPEPDATGKTAGDPAGPGTEVAAAAASSPFDDPSARIVGLVRVYLERYLHLQLDLIYDTDLIPDPSQLLIPSPVDAGPPEVTVAGPKRQPVSFQRAQPRPGTGADRISEESAGEFESEKASGPRTLRVRLVESRRMRSTEVHYFDHPVIGVIATITPWEIPIEPELDPAEAAATASSD
jgi:peptidoglycan-binding protein CsiV